MFPSHKSVAAWGRVQNEDLSRTVGERLSDADGSMLDPSDVTKNW